MTINVKLFAAARELAGADTATVEVDSGATVADVRDALLNVYPGFARLVPVCLWAVDAQYATESTRVSEQTEIALIPPVSGG